LDLPRYDRARVDGRWFAFDDIAAVSRRLAKLPIEARMAHPCIGADRAELVVVGCAILEAIYATWPIPHLRVADRGVREGLLFELMRAADRQPPHKHRPTTRQNR
jgi:exopolyphosphatase/guanosine-5'-triphosphate,3'-diphosphate pyrophosphatase